MNHVADSRAMHKTNFMAKIALETSKRESLATSQAKPVSTPLSKESAVSDCTPYGPRYSNITKQTHDWHFEKCPSSNESLSDLDQDLEWQSQSSYTCADDRSVSTVHMQVPTNSVCSIKEQNDYSLLCEAIPRDIGFRELVNEPRLSRAKDIPSTIDVTLDSGHVQSTEHCNRNEEQYIDYMWSLPPATVSVLKNLDIFTEEDFRRFAIEQVMNDRKDASMMTAKLAALSKLLQDKAEARSNSPYAGICPVSMLQRQRRKQSPYDSHF